MELLHGLTLISSSLLSSLGSGSLFTRDKAARKFKGAECVMLYLCSLVCPLVWCGVVWCLIMHKDNLLILQNSHRLVSRTICKAGGGMLLILEYSICKGILPKFSVSQLTVC